MHSLESHTKTIEKIDERLQKIENLKEKFKSTIKWLGVAILTGLGGILSKFSISYLEKILK